MKFKKIIFIILIAIMLIYYLINFQFLFIWKIEETINPMSLGSIPYKITIDTRGKVTLSNLEKGKYHYETEYQLDKASYKQIIKTIKRNRFGFIEPEIEGDIINDGTYSIISVTTLSGIKFKKEGTNLKSKRINALQSCVWDIAINNPNSTFRDFCIKIDEIQEQLDKDLEEISRIEYQNLLKKYKK